MTLPHMLFQFRTGKIIKLYLFPFRLLAVRFEEHQFFLEEAVNAFEVFAHTDGPT